MCSVVPEKEDKVDAVWQQMNKGVSSEKLNSILNKHKTVKKTSKKSSSQVSPVLTNSPFSALMNILRCKIIPRILL